MIRDEFEWELDEVDEAVTSHFTWHCCCSEPDVVVALLTANPFICRVKSGDGNSTAQALRMRAPDVYNTNCYP